MKYATIDDVEHGFRTLDADEQEKCAYLLEEAAVIIDAYSKNASVEKKKTVSCRMIRRAIGSGDQYDVPMGASQGSMSAMGYSQSWTMTNGSVGELYISKLEKTLLGAGNRIGSYSPVEDMR